MANQALEQQPRSTSRFNFILGGLVVLAVALAGALLIVFSGLTERYAPKPASFVEVAPGGASVLNPPRQLPDFTLTAHTGEPFSLSDMRGKPVLLSFGYTYCPDVCPLNLMEYRRVHDALGDEAANVGFVFASVDGERDTAERLAQYVAVRHVEDFTVALTGTEAELRRMGVEYGLFFEKNYPEGSEVFYMVDHSASTYLIDEKGRLTTIFGFGTDHAVIVDTIREQLS